MVRGPSVGLAEDLVVNAAILKLDLAAHLVLHRGDPFARHAQAHGERLLGGQKRLPLLGRQMPTRAVVRRHATLAFFKKKT